MNQAEIIKRIALAFSKDNRIPDPDGPYPICCPSFKTLLCTRCYKPISKAKGPCTAVPKEQRWSIKNNLKDS